jgi:hypothetical protein
MEIRALLSLILVTFVLSAKATDAPMPWAFVNGSAKGYSIKLESASPAPGAPITTVGQTVDFKVTVSYQLSIADKGSIFMVVQDETDKSLLTDKKQTSQSVDRGKGTVTLTESLVVPAGSDEIRLFIPLVPSGITHTTGELVIRYPVTDPKRSSGIGYPSVAAALADLHSKPAGHFGRRADGSLPRIEVITRCGRSQRRVTRRIHRQSKELQYSRAAAA